MRTTIILIGLIIAVSTPAKAQDVKSQIPMQLSITAGPEIGESSNRFKVGDAILITLTMTNTATDSQSVCLSSNLYQNL